MKAIRRRHVRHYLLAALIGVLLLGLHESLQTDRNSSACADGDAACSIPLSPNLGVLANPY